MRSRGRRFPGELSMRGRAARERTRRPEACGPGRGSGRGIDAGAPSRHERLPETALEILLYALGALLVVVGIAGLVLPALPGAPLLAVGAVLVAWAEGFTRVGWGTVAVAWVLCALIFAVDFAASAFGAKAFGASKWSIVGATVGLVVGLFLGPVGIVLGPVVGAILFEYARNPDFGRAAKAGAGAFVGFVLGSAVKIALAFVVVGVLLLALFL
jgi:uncharacterized protein YqgC (DUF456 family)